MQRRSRRTVEYRWKSATFVGSPGVLLSALPVVAIPRIITSERRWHDRLAYPEVGRARVLGIRGTGQLSPIGSAGFARQIVGPLQTAVAQLDIVF
jgi:hypothetical protein